MAPDQLAQNLHNWPTLLIADSSPLRNQTTATVLILMGNYNLYLLKGNFQESTGVSKVYNGSEGRYLPPKQKYQPPPAGQQQQTTSYYKEQPFPVSAEGNRKSSFFLLFTEAFYFSVWSFPSNHPLKSQITRLLRKRIHLI